MKRNDLQEEENSVKKNVHIGYIRNLDKHSNIVIHRNKFGDYSIRWCGNSSVKIIDFINGVNVSMYIILILFYQYNY